MKKYEISYGDDEWTPFIRMWGELSHCFYADLSTDDLPFDPEIPQSLIDDAKKHLIGKKPEMGSVVNKIRDADGRDLTVTIQVRRIMGKNYMSIIDMDASLDGVTLISGNGLVHEKDVDVKIHRINLDSGHVEVKKIN